MSSFLDKDLAHFNQRFQQDFKSHIPLLDIVLKYIIKSKGKQMRPRFVLSAAALFGPINDDAFEAESLIELLHTATLVHDDVVDDSYQRRSLFSINALWKNKVAVLVGDYLLSKGMINALEGEHFELLKIVSKAVKSMSEGELLQIEKARKLDIEEDIYFQIIQNKTASLLAAACGSGAYATSKNLKHTEKLSEFGRLTGIAFQLRDDLLDYGSADIGKPKGIDIKEKKMTLPLIYTLQHCSAKEKRKLIYLIKNKNKDKETVRIVLEKVQQYGGIEYATKKMHEYQTRAATLLDEYPQSEAKTELLKLLDETIQRKK